ncbi:MAG: hypothetical protein QOC93_569 [Actinomycetota bacterium]|nr:hypothetical protein [Actinomycetota bacterium]
MSTAPRLRGDRDHPDRCRPPSLADVSNGTHRYVGNRAGRTLRVSNPVGSCARGCRLHVDQWGVSPMLPWGHRDGSGLRRGALCDGPEKPDGISPALENRKWNHDECDHRSPAEAPTPPRPPDRLRRSLRNLRESLWNAARRWPVRHRPVRGPAAHRRRRDSRRPCSARRVRPGRARERDEMTTTRPPALQPLLTRQDRCDRCGAEAKLLALLRTGGELLFCGHHAREHRPRLGDIGAALIPDP